MDTETWETTLSREDLLDAAARLYAEGVAEQADRAPDAAAHASGARTLSAQAAWIAQHRPLAEVPQSETDAAA